MKDCKITSLEIRDIRFPTSDNLDGSDAMNPDPLLRCICHIKN